MYCEESFLVTNALGGFEDSIVRNDTVRREIDEIIVEVFGGANFSQTNNQTLTPFLRRVGSRKRLPLFSQVYHGAYIDINLGDSSTDSSSSSPPNEN